MSGTQRIDRSLSRTTLSKRARGSRAASVTSSVPRSSRRGERRDGCTPDRVAPHGGVHAAVLRHGLELTGRGIDHQEDAALRPRAAGPRAPSPSWTAPSNWAATSAASLTASSRVSSAARDGPVPAWIHRTSSDRTRSRLRWSPRRSNSAARPFPARFSPRSETFPARAGARRA